MIPIQVTPGEALDRLSILLIKHRKAKNEWAELLEEDFNELKAAVSSRYAFAELEPDFLKLLEINTNLWKLEDDMHQGSLTDGRAGTIGRAIALTNGNRSAAKRAVDTRLNIRPEYKNYG